MMEKRVQDKDKEMLGKVTKQIMMTGQTDQSERQKNGEKGWKSK